MASVLRRVTALRASAPASCCSIAAIPQARPFHATTRLREDEDGGNKAYGPKSAGRMVSDRPWLRQDSHAGLKSTSPDPPRSDDGKGRLLTTPTRLLKLILPLPFHPEQEHINPTQDEAKSFSKETVEPLALLVHPQQPLSYLERLIQAETPPLQVNDREKLPSITFRAEADQEEKLQKQDASDDNVASYSGLGHEGPQREGQTRWVRWSSSTEVGDFIRDAARGREFSIEIEGHKEPLRVAVPSFSDRTYYMRVRLRRLSREIDASAQLKHECDQLAHKGAHRIAQGGFAMMATWWGIVYYVTFHTEMGWDLVEPVTYLVGLSMIMCGYLWFMYMSRDLSYKAAMNLTVSRRQHALYQDRGLDVAKWEQQVLEANTLRREIRMVSNEYGVEWDEKKDLGSEKVKKMLEKEDKGKEAGKKEDVKEEVKEEVKEGETKKNE